ncbi:MAG: hypothetical protein Q6363_006815 [Candidatus Njordarchaeota archaeon]
MPINTEYNSMSNLVNILSYIEYILSEIDYLYLRVLFFRNNKLLLKNKIDKNILKLYEQLLGTYERLINSIIKRKLNLQKQIRSCSTTIAENTVKPPKDTIDKFASTINSRIISNLQQIEEKINILRKHLSSLNRVYEYLTGLDILDNLEHNEHVLYMLAFDNQRIIITNIRIFVHDASKGTVNFFYITDIEKILLKNSLFFKGCIIKLIDKSKIKIPLSLRKSKHLKRILTKVINLNKNSLKYSPKKIIDERSLIRPNIKTLKTELLRCILDNHTR